MFHIIKKKSLCCHPIYLYSISECPFKFLSHHDKNNFYYVWRRLLQTRFKDLKHIYISIYISLNAFKNRRYCFAHGDPVLIESMHVRCKRVKRIKSYKHDGILECASVGIRNTTWWLYGRMETASVVYSFLFWAFWMLKKKCFDHY